MSDSVVLPATPLSPKPTKFWPAFFLAMFLGIFGAHRFYLKSPSRVLMLFTLGGFGIWALIDILTILLGKFKDETGQTITNPKPTVSWFIFIMVGLFGVANNDGTKTPTSAETGSTGNVASEPVVSLSGEYFPVSETMTAESLLIKGPGLVYMGVIDDTNQVAHNGIFKVLKESPEEIQFACSDATITLTVSGSSRKMKADFTGIVTFKNRETFLEYSYRNLESERGGIETKRFRKK